MEMRKEIINKLKEIEKREHVKIIYAIESGSRAWGFESVDSDYDVRFIYVREKEDYLCLDEKSDVIELPIDEVFDISGWDIKKALKLLYKSNPSLLEWFASPIVYKETKEASYIREVIPLYFSQKKSYHHYQNMAKTLLNIEKVPVKKYLYILRCILSSQYIIHNKKQPPIEIERLIECELPNELREDINQLLMIKKNSNEKQYVDHISSLDEFIVNSLQERDTSSLVDGESSWELLNEVFRKVIEKNSDDMF
jgi:predicted nucleotidyltransferase